MSTTTKQQQIQEVKTPEQIAEEKAERHTIKYIWSQKSIGKRILKAEILDFQEVEEKGRKNLLISLKDHTGQINLNVDQKYREAFKSFSPGEWIRIEKVWGKKEENGYALFVHANPLVTLCALPAKEVKTVKEAVYYPFKMSIEIQIECEEDLDYLIQTIKKLTQNRSVKMKRKNQTT